jgi:hypothetical protein
LEAPLPSDRVLPTNPFAVTGIDFAGPLYVRSSNVVKKAYIVLFTCVTTRAVHLELYKFIHGQVFNGSATLCGQERFTHTIYSDNAQNFQAANRELMNLFEVTADPKTHAYLAHDGVTWKFIASRAAWWGGWWERIIGSTKRCLRKVLGRSQADEEELLTILTGIEAALNSRPVGQGGDNWETLTPSHLLSGDKLTAIPYGPEPDTNKDLSRQFKKEDLQRISHICEGRNNNSTEDTKKISKYG